MLKKIPRTIPETQKGLLQGEFSAVDLVDGYLARINKHDKVLNSFITVTDDYAYHAAKAIDKRIATGGEDLLEQYPLLGVVVSLKDMYLTSGIRTTAASKVLKDYVPVYTATIVKKLEEAGVIVIGKTNQDAWAHGASGENSDFGPTKNPWDIAHVPGGSSSGSAVSVSAGFSLISMGTDTGGSVRLPASYCGLVGLKPTYGSVSRYGVISMGSSLDSMGHFTTTVEDSRQIFEVTRGEDGRDGTVVKSKPKSTKSKLKIGLPKEYFLGGLDPQVEKTVRNAVKTYRDNGVEIVDVSLPHTKYGGPVYYIVMSAEVSSNLGRYDGVRYGADREAFDDEAKRRIMLGSYVLSAGYYEEYYLKAMQVRSKIIDDFDQVFEKVDAILSPVSPTSAFKLGEKIQDPLSMYLMDILTVNANLAGIPALAIPAGLDNAGLPVGFQLMGPRFGESTLFDLGELFQKKTKHHLEEPKL